jgi:helicase MOV-10
MIFGVGVVRGYFSHIFVDEAGQALEPESLVPILGMIGKSTNVILSGDPKQLGPIVRSPHAKGFGMWQSLLERLMSCESYNSEVGRDL